MIVVAQKSALKSKDLLGLQPDPFGSISQCVDLALESPTRATSAVAPTPTDFVNLTKGGGVNLLSLAYCLGYRQTYFLPVSRLFTFTRASRDRANQTPVRLGHHILSSLCW